MRESNDCLSSRSQRKSIGETLGALIHDSSSRRIVALATFAFFISFVIWFDMAPFALSIGKELHLSKLELGALALSNLALAVPGRVAAGRLLDRFGPRRVYGWLLIGAFIPNTWFSLAHSFSSLVLSRLVLGLVGSGFVVGIRLVAEWVKPTQIGIAEGIYGGWGNFGSAGASLVLPIIVSSFFHGPGAWRWGVFSAGLLGLIYGVIFLVYVRDTPEGMAYIRPAKVSALMVTSRKAIVGLSILQVPLIVILGVVASRLTSAHVFSSTTALVIYIALGALLVYQVGAVIRTNDDVIRNRPSLPPYRFSSIVILSCAYAVTFGTELTMVSLLPTYFGATFGLKIAAAGIAGSAFAFTNLVTRPGGGLLSDMSKSRRATLMWFLIGAAFTFVILSGMSKSWPLPLGIALIALASVFIQGGNGAVFAMVPLIEKEVTGQAAGLVGAYGNFGGLVLSSLLYYTATKTSIGNVHVMFITIAIGAMIVAFLTRFLPNFTSKECLIDEPEQTMSTGIMPVEIESISS